MIVEAIGKVMQVLSKIEGVSVKTGKAWEKFTYLIEQSGICVPLLWWFQYSITENTWESPLMWGRL
jgi:hypothetical protein